MFSLRFFRPRGWLLLGFGALALLLAAVLGRRDLLNISVFCFALPVLALAALHLSRPGFTVKRTLYPALGRVGTPVDVDLDVHGRSPGGSRTRLAEELPFSFRDTPTFSHPDPVVPKGLLSRYHYTLHPSHRGVFTIGPLRGDFADPFDVALLPRMLDAGIALTIAPAAVELPTISITDGSGQDGSRSTIERAHASYDDALMREYRHGDSLRRVHWPVTARQGKLMVRAEESVTTPEAVLLLDRQALAFESNSRATGLSQTGLPQMAGRSTVVLPQLLTSVTFERAVIASLSVATHLLERNYALRILDQEGMPGFASSASAVSPDREEFNGMDGILDVATALAALELAEPAPTSASSPSAQFAAAQPAAAVGARAGRIPYGDALVHKLRQGRKSGPLVAVTGLLEKTDALLLAGLAESSQSAHAIVVCQDAEQVHDAVDVLRAAGWQVATLTPDKSLLQTWLELDQHSPGTRRFS